MYSSKGWMLMKFFIRQIANRACNTSVKGHLIVLLSGHSTDKMLNMEFGVSGLILQMLPYVLIPSIFW